MKRLALKLSALASALALLPYAAQAQFGGALDKVKNGVAKSAGYSVDPSNGGDLLGTIGALVKIAVGLTGVIFVLYMIYAGYLWLTAGGDSKNVDKAKGIIRNCVIGLVVIVLAYGITSFVFQKLACAQDVTQCGATGSVTPGN